MTPHNVLLILALLSFILATIEVPAKINLIALGLTFGTASLFF
jgi:hypothetical protein